MNVQDQIDGYIASHPEPKCSELQKLHELALTIDPKAKLWFTDGKNSEGKVVANPNIGYGSYMIKYGDGSTREFYQVGLCANTSGISVYVMGLPDKSFLKNTYAPSLGKASVTGYCIKFRSIKDIDLNVLGSAIKHGLEAER